MKELAQYVDYALIAQVVLTVGLILYKGLELWAPGLVGKASFEARAGHTPAQLEETVESLESGMSLLATIAAAAPFVGLVGTVMHIILALRALSGSAIDITVISGPIATALNATLIGLAAAIPAAIAYNLMQRRLQVLHNRQLRRLKRHDDKG